MLIKTNKISDSSTTHPLVQCPKDEVCKLSDTLKWDQDKEVPLLYMTTQQIKFKMNV